MNKTEKESRYFKAKTKLEDLIDYDLKVLFVGSQPTVAVLKAGHHFANDTNLFWQFLSESNLVDGTYKSYQESKLPKRDQIGIVTLYTNEYELTMTQLANNKLKLTKMIRTYRPRVICFVGKCVYKDYSGFDCLEYGLQKMSIAWDLKDGESLVFVMPNTNKKVRFSDVSMKTSPSRYFDKLSLLAQQQQEKYPKGDMTTTDTQMNL